MNVSADILRELLIEAGVDRTTAQAVRPDLALMRQGVDSLDYPSFCLAVQSRFGLVIDERSSLSLRTLDDFAGYIGGSLGQKQSLDKAGAALQDKPKTAPLDKYEVGPLRPGDGPGVVKLFQAIYGDRYPVSDYYDPERIESLNARGQLLTVVARLDSGGIAGQGAYYQSSPPNKALFEFGQLLVLPEYRKSPMAIKITRRMLHLSRTMSQAQGFFGEAVCNHLITQKLVDSHGYAECGLELSLMPEGAYEKEGAGGQRVSCLLAARVDRDQRLPLHLPECYRPELEHILEGFSLDREVFYSGQDRPLAECASLEVRAFDFAGVERVQVLAVGADFPGRLHELDLEAKDRGLAVVQVFVNTGQPGVAFAVEALRANGFILGGLLPLWFGPDALLMQKLYVEPEFETINLLSDRSKQILTSIRADWCRARALV